MKLATYQYQGKQFLGIVDINYDLIYPVKSCFEDVPNNMIDWIKQVGKKVHDPSFHMAKAISLSQVKILAPIPTPERNLMCVGKNYSAHASEFAGSGYDRSSTANTDDIPEAPIIFTKATSSVIGPFESIICPTELSEKLDYEAELGVVIGQGGRNIHRDNAYKHIFGYVIVNDVTARDLQALHRQWFIGKSIDTFCPMGPWLVTADEIDAENLNVRCWINNELRQNANTKDLIFNIPILIETLSAAVTLKPGDIIATGTPAGVGIGMNPPVFLKQGDRIKIEIDGLGVLENFVQ